MAKNNCPMKRTSIGGQALIEGIMMRGPEKTAMAVRNVKSGRITLEEYPTRGKDRAKIFKLPFVRGIFNMIDSLSFGYKCLMRSAELSGIEEEENGKAKKPSRWDKVFEAVMMPLATVLAVVLALGLFVWLPEQLWKWMTMRAPAVAANYYLRACFSGVMRIVLFVGYVWATSLMKDIRRTYQYHGAEHKTIFCYEAGLPLTVENVRPQVRFHPRCGTSFMVLMLIVGIIVSMFIRIDFVPLRVLVKLLTFPIVVGIGYELIKWAGRTDNLFTRVVSAPGKWLQHITTREPDDSMIECAIEAMKLVIPGDDSDN
ncbi:MAG: DUF1385 domain-containing protein, partial [Clostridia bacterium]|nr:DUF1385 domain-containing protein [Clostridia bacterium]